MVYHDVDQTMSLCVRKGGRGISLLRESVTDIKNVL